MQPVVGAQDLDVVASGQLEAAVEVCEKADVARVDVQAKARIGAVGLDNSSRVVGRGVVDDDQLEVGVGLVQHALDRAPDEARVVVGGDADADQDGREPTNGLEPEWAVASPPTCSRRCDRVGRLSNYDGGLLDRVAAKVRLSLDRLYNERIIPRRAPLSATDRLEGSGPRVLS